MKGFNNVLICFFDTVYHHDNAVAAEHTV